MPLKLVPPRLPKTPHYYLRGTYLGIAVYRSCKTDRRSVALGILKSTELAIERGDYGLEAAPGDDGPSFVAAAVAYMNAGRRRRHVSRLIKYFGETPIGLINQAIIDKAANEICPDRTPGTKNATVYTPVSAILRHAGLDIHVRRPKGHKGRMVTDWISLEDAQAILTEAERIDAEFALLLQFLLYTGARLGEVLRLEWNALQIDEATAWVRSSKNDDPRTLQLRKSLCEVLARHRKAVGNRQRVFRFHQGGDLKHKLMRAKLAALQMSCPARRPAGWRQPPNRLSWLNFHSFRHTWATWMRKYGGVDIQGLVATRNWRDPRSAARYSHVVARDEWAKVEILPDVKITTK